jgi:hypothetical protein
MHKKKNQALLSLLRLELLGYKSICSHQLFVPAASSYSYTYNSRHEYYLLIPAPTSGYIITAATTVLTTTVPANI